MAEYGVEQGPAGVEIASPAVPDAETPPPVGADAGAPTDPYSGASQVSSTIMNGPDDGLTSRSGSGDDGWDAGVADVVLAGMAGGRSLEDACSGSGVDVGRVLVWRSRRPEFARRYQEAFGLYVDHLELEYGKLATGGLKDGQRRMTDTELRTRESALRFMLEKLRPEKYGSKPAGAGDGGDAAKAAARLSALEVARRIAFAVERAGGEAMSAERLVRLLRPAAEGTAV